MNFNNDPVLFRNLRESQLAQGRSPAPLRVVDGMVCGVNYILARFDTCQSACKCLKAAGYSLRDGSWYA